MTKITYICDECGDEFEANEGDDFRQAWEDAKDAGWVCYKDGDTWKHKCDECRHNR